MDTLDLILKYVVVPVGAFVWMIHTKMQSHQEADWPAKPE